MPLAQFANNSEHSSIGVAPFFANYGFNPAFQIGPRPKSLVQAADERSDHIKAVQAELKLTLAASVRSYKEYADCTRQVRPAYQKGDLVMLDARNIKLKVPCRKLGPKRIGPYRISRKVGQAAYALELPKTVSVYPVFHESLLSPYSGTAPSEPQAILVEDSIEHEVEAIVSSKIHRRQLKYLVAWKGYTEADYSWLSAKECCHCQDLVDAYHEKFPNAVGPLRPKTSSPPTFAAMKLPKAHKNFPLAGTPAGGVTPRRKEEGDVRACKFDFGITRPKKRKDTKTATAAPLIKFGDLKFTIDRKWVAAAPVISNVVEPNSRKAPDGESNHGRAPEASRLAQGIEATNRKQDRGPRKRRTAHESKSV